MKIVEKRFFSTLYALSFRKHCSAAGNMVDWSKCKWNRRFAAHIRKRTPYCRRVMYEEEETQTTKLRRQQTVELQD